MTIDWDCWNDPDRYGNNQYDADMGQQVDLVLQHLKEDHDSGRNQDCWPLCAFDGKDADLEKDGCCGIKELVRADEFNMVFRVGGHKTVVSPTLDQDIDLPEKTLWLYHYAAEDFVMDCPYSGEWTGDEWVMSYETTITVPWHWSKVDADNPDNVGDIDHRNMAADVVRLSEEALKGFREAMTKLDKDIEWFYDLAKKEESGEIEPTQWDGYEEKP